MAWEQTLLCQPGRAHSVWDKDIIPPHILSCCPVRGHRDNARRGEQQSGFHFYADTKEFSALAAAGSSSAGFGNNSWWVSLLSPPKDAF